MFKSATTLINHISLAHNIDGCDAQGHGATCAAAYELLKQIDSIYHREWLDSSVDAASLASSDTEPHWSTELQNSGSNPDLNADGERADRLRIIEDEGYKEWSARFDVEEDLVPDAFIRALLRHVCGVHPVYKHGRTLWRVRRVQEQVAELEGTAAVVPARAENNASSPLLGAASSPFSLLPPMNASLPLRDIVESSGPGVTYNDVAPADTLPSHIYHPHTAAKEEATSATTEPLSQGTTIPPQSLAIEPVIEEFAASSAVNVDVDASRAARPVDGFREDGSLARPQLVEREIAQMVISEPGSAPSNDANAEFAARAVVPASIRSGPVEETAGSNLTVDNSTQGLEEISVSMVDETSVEIVRAGRDEQALYGHASLVSSQRSQRDPELRVRHDGFLAQDENDSASRMEFADALAIPGHALDRMGESVSQRGMMLDSAQPTRASEDEDESGESGQ
ncbi:hypothetical protein EIP86_011314 [Pleurotus ostreatoroseus]|nr:hypothetical protein EIP86_011314 [Pleurotus ostreatoroseus]